MAHDNSGKQLNTFHLFAGAGGGILADLLLGHNPIGACEIEPYPREVLLQRQRDGILPEFPIWDDICTLDGRPWRGKVSILHGGFPCQDISAQGANHGEKLGINGDRSGLWSEYLRIIKEMRPEFVFAENSPLLRTRGLGTVLTGLATLGYDAKWCRLGGGAVGADHKRERDSGYLPTVLATDWKGGTTAIRKDKGKQRLDQWRDYVKVKYSLTYPHPTHSELRMGWPEGWTDLKPLEMVKYLKWRHSHGKF
jgi:site-specific DNA-cytosine methylase